MPRIHVRSELTYEVRKTTVFLFQIAAATTPRQKIHQEQLLIGADIGIEVCKVGVEGNRLHRLVAEPGLLEIVYDAVVDLSPACDQPTSIDETPIAEMPPEVLTYLNPSRYCESELLARFAIEEFGSLPRGFHRVKSICDWVYDHLEYTPGSTTSTTTASDVLLQRTGVCRDYAHLAVTLCRGLGIPARYVAGYAADLEPPDFHGFIEAFLDGEWYLFDPTRLASTLGLVRIGVGRDAADVAFATLTGSATLKEKQVMAEFLKDAPDPSIEPAVSTA